MTVVNTVDNSTVGVKFGLVLLPPLLVGVGDSSVADVRAVVNVVSAGECLVGDRATGGVVTAVSSVLVRYLMEGGVVRAVVESSVDISGVDVSRAGSSQIVLPSENSSRLLEDWPPVIMARLHIAGTPAQRLLA